MSAGASERASGLELRPGEELLRGVVERIVFYNDENHYCIAELRPDRSKEMVTIVGTFPEVQCGETLKIAGQWVDHRSYGRQFKSRTFEAILPATLYGIRRFLGSGLIAGIGKTYADKIVDHFGTDTLRVIDEESARLREIPGIGKKRAGEIKASWERQRALREIMVFLQTYGVTVSQCLRIVRRYGAQAKEVLLTDPYQVAREVDGIGFKTADKLAINLGFANDSPERLDAGILHALKDLEMDGHTGFPSGELPAHAAELLQSDPAMVSDRLAALIASGELRLSGDLVQLPHQEIAERRIAETLTGIAGAPSILPDIKVDIAIRWAAERAGFDFAPEQSHAIGTALRSKVSVLTGGPGTGKTTILRALVEILEAKKVRVLMAAPTGRAAQRMAQSTGKSAGTIHRLLKFDAATGAFNMNEGNPLNAAFVIVDEASMLDNRLAAALIRAIPMQAHLLLVGDADQLPSVGAGNVLGDIVGFGRFPVTRLMQIFRQGRGSRIVETAHAILAGEAPPPFVVESLDEIDPRRDLYFIKAAGPEVCPEIVVDLVTRRIPLWFPKTDRMRDVQLLAPMHRGAAGVEAFNRLLQETSNAGSSGVVFGQTTFRAGDKVIQVRNDYDKGVFNGDIGIVTRAEGDSGVLAVDFEGSLVEYERSDLSDLQLAYAITIHKSQGSEFSIVVIPLLKQHFLLLQRNLIYTALTRGRKKVFLVGDPGAYAMAVANSEAKLRHSGLKLRLEGN